MKGYVLVFFILGLLLGFGTSVVANGYLTGRNVEQEGFALGTEAYVASNPGILDCP